MVDITERWPRGEASLHPLGHERQRPKPLVDAWPVTGPGEGPAFDLADALGALRRRLPSLLGTVVVIGLLFAARSARQPVFYSAQAEVLVGRSVADLVADASAATPADAERTVQNERRILTGSKILSAATAQLGAAPDIEVTAVAATDILRVTAKADSAREAARVANVVIDAYVADRDEQFSEAIKATEARLASATAAPVAGQQGTVSSTVDQLQRVLSRLQIARSGETGAGTLVVTNAVPPKASDRAGIVPSLLLGLVVGSLIGIAVALIREHLDGSVRSVENLLADTALPGGGVVALRAGAHHQDQTFQELLLLLAARSFGDSARSIAVVGVTKDERRGWEGLGVVVAGLARAIASTGTSVAVTSVGAAKSALARQLPTEEATGPYRYNAGDSGLRRVVGVPSLYVQPGPAGDPPANLAGPARVAVLDGLASKVEIVIVEAGLIDENGRGATGALLVDAALLIVDTRASRQRVRGACAALRTVGARPLATVLVTGRDGSARRWAGLFKDADSASRAESTEPEQAEDTLRVVRR